MNYQAIGNEQSNFEEDKSSSIESAASNDSNLIGLNPDGSLMKATPAFKYNAKKEEENKYNEMQPGSQIIYIIDQEEIIFFADANEIPAYFDDFVDLYLRHQRNFLIYLVVAIVSEILCEIIGYMGRNDTLLELENLYPRASVESLTKLLYSIMTIDASFAAFYYAVGLIAIWRRSSRFLGYFTSLSMLGLLIEMILAYVDRFNFYVFLLSLLLIPRVTQQQQNA